MGIPKIGGPVPVERYLYFTLRKPLKPKEICQIGDHRVGEVIAIEATDYSKLGSAEKNLLTRKFRKSNDSEVKKKYTELCKNAIVGVTYPDGTYNIYRFYTPNYITLQILRDYDGFKDCVKDITLISQLKNRFHISMEDGLSLGRVIFGKLQDKFFFFSEFNNDSEQLLSFGTPMDCKDIPRFFAHTKEVIELNKKAKNKSMVTDY